MSAERPAKIARGNVVDDAVGAKPLGVAMCGGGRIGSVHLKSLVSAPGKFRLIYFVDIDLDRAADMAKQAGAGCKGVSDVRMALGDDEVEAVVICSPTGTHVELITLSLNAGKHVFCEKPISLKHPEVLQCYQLAQQKGLQLYCAYQRRADTSFRNLKDHIVDGKIGQIQIVKSTSRDHPSPNLAFLKISGGFFHDCASHDIDLCCWVTGERPTHVYATAHAFNPDIAALDDVDTAVIHLQFPSGVFGIIDVSRLALYGYDQRLEVHGSLGMVQTLNPEQSSCVLSVESGIIHDKPHFSFPQRYTQAYATEMHHFFDILRHSVIPWVDGPGCAVVAQIADAADRSSKTHQIVEMHYGY